MSGPVSGDAWRRVLAGAICCWSLGSAPVLAGAGLTPEATAIDYRETGGRGILEIQMTAAVPFTFFSLADPARLVFDFEELSWPADPPQIEAQEWISGIRLGASADHTGRLVLDLKHPMKVRDAALTGEGEAAGLRVEITKDTEAAFAARAALTAPPVWQQPKIAVPEVAAEQGDIVIAIDPGHGGIDPGAEVGGMIEKSLVLRFSRRLAQEIGKQPGMTAFLTRERDTFIRLADRIRIARKGGAHAFISIHADLLEEGEASGMSVYTLSDLGSEEAEEILTVKENRDSVIGSMDLTGAGDDLTKVLIDLAQRGTRSEADKLADSLLDILRPDFKLLKTRPHRRAGYRVLKAPDIPSVLVELGFLSSEADRKRLSSRAWQVKAAEALTAGIVAWTKVASPGFLSAKR